LVADREIADREIADREIADREIADREKVGAKVTQWVLILMRSGSLCGENITPGHLSRADDELGRQHGIHFGKEIAEIVIRRKRNTRAIFGDKADELVSAFF
jgi:hypothetical protein